jgi:hypothetical protein
MKGLRVEGFARHDLIHGVNLCSVQRAGVLVQRGGGGFECFVWRGLNHCALRCSFCYYDF